MNRRALHIAALSLVLAAGTVSSAADGLVISRTKGTTAISLHGGASFRTTGASVFNQRLIAVPNSRKLIALWDEATPGGAVEHFYALSLDGRTFAQVLPTTYDIRLVYASFDPKQGEPGIPPALQADASCSVYLVQFVVPPLDEFRRDVAALGGTVESFLTDHTHIVTMDAAAAARVSALPYVRWVGKYHPAYRMSAEVRAEALGGAADLGAQRYSIQVHRRGMTQQQALGDAVRAMGGIVEVFSTDQFRMEATLTRAQLLTIARKNEVCYIDPWGGPGGTDMNVIRQLVGAVPTLSALGMTGQGVRGEVHDTEVRLTHQAFQSPQPLLHGGSAGSAAELHGSSCYGINFAKWAANPNYNGVMTDTEQGIFIAYPLSTQFGGGTTRLTFNTQATDPAGVYKSSYQTSSVGSAQITNYSTISAETDDYLFQVDYLSCQSQSNTNSQTSRPQAWAKNIVSVGGVNWLGTLARADDNHNGASYGPAADLRQKPDLTNCYDAIPATDGSGDAATTTFGGTSGATPITAGCFGLLTQMWHQGIFPNFGGGSTAFADRPRSTTAKAMMINTAFRYPLTQGNLTRARQGWGMADLTNLYNLRNKLTIINETDVITNAETKTYNFNVAPGEPSVGFTMVFSDPAGNPAAAQARINDLTLKVTDSNGQIYWGNGGLSASNFSTPGGAANTVDTVENVFVQNPPSGNWSVEVIGSQVVQDAHLETPGVTDADFALVASGVIPGPPPPLFIQLPGGAPSLIAPGASTDITVRVIPGSQSVVAGSPTMYYRLTGAGAFTAQTLTPLTGNDYRATLPALLCASTPQYYFTAQGSLGATISLPSTAPASFLSSAVGTVSTSTLLTVDFDGALPPGWSAGGLWHISSACAPSGTPCAGAQSAYYGQDGPCTYNNGATNTGTLLSPAIALPTVPTGGSVTLTYCSAKITENNASYDKAEVLVNGGVVSNAPESAAWGTQTVDLTAFAGQVVTLGFRFNTIDNLVNDFRGWHIDNVRITATGTTCTDPATCYANCDNSTSPPTLNSLDFGCFLTKFAAGDTYANCDNSTGVPVLNALDFGCFLTKFAAGCT